MFNDFVSIEKFWKKCLYQGRSNVKQERTEEVIGQKIDEKGDWHQSGK